MSDTTRMTIQVGTCDCGGYGQLLAEPDAALEIQVRPPQPLHLAEPHPSGHGQHRPQRQPGRLGTAGGEQALPLLPRGHPVGRLWLGVADDGLDGVAVEPLPLPDGQGTHPLEGGEVAVDGGALDGLPARAVSRRQPVDGLAHHGGGEVGQHHLAEAVAPPLEADEALRLRHLAEVRQVDFAVPVDGVCDGADAGRAGPFQHRPQALRLGLAPLLRVALPVLRGGLLRGALHPHLHPVGRRAVRPGALLNVIPAAHGGRVAWGRGGAQAVRGLYLTSRAAESMMGTDRGETSMTTDPITRHARKIEAEVKASQWLANGNAARERGDFDLAERHFERATRWLDEYNRLAGNR